MSKIYAVDFDGTLHFGRYPNIGKPNKELIAFLKKAKEQGNKVILWSCRQGKRLDEAVDWTQKHKLTFDAVNGNLPESIRLYGYDSRKIHADIYIDDKATDYKTLLTGKKKGGETIE